jgi:hypothetical protein
MNRITSHRYTRPDNHPRSRRRVARAIKEFVRTSRNCPHTSGQALLMSTETFVLGLAKMFIRDKMRGQPAPPPQSPEAIAFQVALGELSRAIDSRAAIVRGFDDYEAEWILAAARKAVEA